MNVALLHPAVLLPAVPEVPTTMKAKTVAQVIAELQKLPQSLEVWCAADAAIGKYTEVYVDISGFKGDNGHNVVVICNEHHS